LTDDAIDKVTIGPSGKILFAIHFKTKSNYSGMKLVNISNFIRFFVYILKALEFYRQKCKGLCRKIYWGIPILPIFRALRIPE